MKALKISALVVAGMAAVSCGNNYQVKGDNYGVAQSKVDSVSYALGMSLGNLMKQNDFGAINMDEFCQGFVAVLNDEDPKIPMQDAGMTIQGYMMERNKKVSDFNKKEGEDFLAQNKTKDGVKETESGLQYKILEEGSAELKPTAKDTVVVNYKGTFINGETFDSSYDRGEPAEFPLGGVIKGWTEGLQLIGEGGKAILYVPSELAYGQYAPAQIGANRTLIFEVELIKVKKNEAPAEKTDKK